MESIEVWMWVIAGLIIGSIMFISGTTLLSRYLHSQDISTARQDFQEISTMTTRLCRLGIYSQETKTYVIPLTLERLSVENADGVEGVGDKLCLYIKGQEGKSCLSTDTCTVTMKTLTLQAEQQNPFILIQKITGQNQPVKVEFSATKTGLDQLEVTWKQK